MKRAIWMTLGLALLLSVPALSGGEEEAALQKQVDKLKLAVAAQGAAIKEMQSWILVRKAEGKALAKAVRTAEKKGFLYPAPHVDAKRVLLQGLKQFAGAKAEQPKQE